jgi:hypothetical protein
LQTWGGKRFVLTEGELGRRFSSDNQREASIADQFRICRVYAEKQGWNIVAEYSDRPSTQQPFSVPRSAFSGQRQLGRIALLQPFPKIVLVVGKLALQPLFNVLRVAERCVERRHRIGPSSERRALLGQLELSLFELEEDQAEAETRHEIGAPRGVKVQPFERRKPARRALPDHLPRERIVYPGPQACPCCGGALHKLGEDVTETSPCPEAS